MLTITEDPVLGGLVYTTTDRRTRPGGAQSQSDSISLKLPQTAGYAAGAVLRARGREKAPAAFMAIARQLNRPGSLRRLLAKPLEASDGP